MNKSLIKFFAIFILTTAFVYAAISIKIIGVLSLCAMIALIVMGYGFLMYKFVTKFLSKY
jgi:hypothetical protein